MVAMATSLSTAGPHLTQDSYGPSKPTTQTASRILIGLAVFAHMTAEYPYTLQWDAPFPLKLAPFPSGIWTPI